VSDGTCIVAGLFRIVGIAVGSAKYKLVMAQRDLVAALESITAASALPAVMICAVLAAEIFNAIVAIQE
jgi:hypothetical protein